MADGDPIIFTEISGPTPRRTFTLAGPERPERGVRVGGKLRLVKTWYPGAEEASVQVMGTEEDPIMIAGWLNDVWNGLDGGAVALRAEFDALRVRQRRLRMQWGTTIDVEGFLEELVFDIHRTSLIRYEGVFMVALGNQAEAIAPTPFPQSSETDLVDALDNAINFIDDETPGIVATLAAVAAIL